MTRKATKATPKKRREWKEKFLDALRESPNVSAAAKAAGHNRQHVYHMRKSDAEFATDWDDALAEAVDNLEGEMYRRAVYGTRKPVYQGGHRVGEIQEYSDTLAIFMAKAHRPDKYRETVNQQHGGKVEHVLRVVYDAASNCPKGTDNPPAAATSAPE